jgi:hypothetical protein
MFLNSPHAMFELADQNAVADHGRMIFDHRLSQRGLTVLDILQPAAVVMQQ